MRKTVDLCQKVEAAGVSWITVHGRTADERHQPVHYDAIRLIKESLRIPVIANGDIKTPRDVETVCELTGVDGRSPLFIFLFTVGTKSISDPLKFFTFCYIAAFG